MSDFTNGASYLVIDLGGEQAFQGLGGQLASCLESITGIEPNKICLSFDESQTYCSEDKSDIIKLQQLSDQVTIENSFCHHNRGVFVVLSCQQSKKLNELFSGGTALAVSTMGVDETNPIAFEENGDSSPFWPRFLELLQRTHARNRVILFTLDPLNFPQVKDWRFDIVQLRNEDSISEYVLTRIGRDIFNFSLRVDERDKELFVRKEAKHGQTSGTHTGSLLQSEYQDWFRQEFGSLSVSLAFLSSCWKPLCKLPIPKEDEPTDRFMLPWQAQIAVGVTRMCRRMSTWTLEGEPFECTVVLVGQEPDAILKENGARFRSLIELDTPCPFNFDYEDEIRQYAEMAQGPPLLMIISARDGHLHHLATSLMSDNSGLSHRYFKELAGEHGIVFRVRPPAKVDIFTRDRLALGYDGFQWNEAPFDKLEKAANNHFEIKDVQQKCVDRLIESTQRLLDQSQSSIFILVPEAERKTALELTSESLRPSILWPTQTRIKIGEVDPAVLASILQLDGAHLIDQDGEVFAISRRINARLDARHRIGLSEKEFDSIRQKLHCLPSGAMARRIQQPSNEDFGELVFPRRISPQWIEDWDETNVLLTTPGLGAKIKAEIVEELTELYVLGFVQDFTVHSLRGLQSQLTTENVDNNIIQYDDDKIGLVLWDSRKGKKAPSDEMVFVKTVVEDICKQANRGKHTLTKEWFVDRMIPKTTKTDDGEIVFPGLVLTPDGRVLVLERLFMQVMNARGLPTGLYEGLFDWHRYGSHNASKSSGTGTRAAEEIHHSLPQSSVVKVSASGKLSVKRSTN
ncbi:hypothetical protein [Gimesia sp.]|uniref:hypothetical protein n=1 Tax=Gimesia sp. TaxID=2024833 RepID=UPI003A92CA68